MIDFMVPTGRESFGQAFVEALAAGKVVMTDPETGAVFGRGVIASRPDDVDAAVERLIADPAAHAAQAAHGQAALDGFSAAAFAVRLKALIGAALRARAA
ncbi:glycosyltransferase [Rhodovulum steppense]|nr:glycosyltransferase [Rhodovulum steppense]